MTMKKEQNLNNTETQALNTNDVSNNTALEKPTPEKYGWYNQQGFDNEPPSGWVFEGSEEAYCEALKRWEEQQ